MKPASQARHADQWRPDPEEEAAIRAAELAESQRSTRTRRERGGLLRELRQGAGVREPKDNEG